MIFKLSFLIITGFSYGCSKPIEAVTATVAKDVPTWVKGEMETIKLKAPTASYLQVEQTASILRPQPLTKIEDIEALNPGLAQALPRLPELLKKAEVSPKFKEFYDAKIKSIAAGEILSTSHYFDCATVLHLRDETSDRHAIVFQSDMDVDTDGTDPVRLPRLEDYNDARISRSFQPLLAYSWPNSATEPAVNPFIGYYAETLTKMRSLQQQVAGEAQKDHGYIWQGLQKQVDETISSLDKRAKYYDEDLRGRRSLVGSLDPFIVVPMTWVDRLKQPYSVQVGDFVAVVHGANVYPCLIGDTGGETKAGEASQKLAQAINPKASGRSSAVTTVAVTYVIFPQTRLAMGPPDFAVYHREVTRLLNEIGGLGAGLTLERWQ